MTSHFHVQNQGVEKWGMKKSTNWSSKLPSTFEPLGCSRKDNIKRPDGLNYATSENERYLIWDSTCADTLCKSYLKKAYIFLAIKKHKKTLLKSTISKGIWTFFPAGPTAQNSPEWKILIRKVAQDTFAFYSVRQCCLCFPPTSTGLEVN